MSMLDRYISTHRRRLFPEVDQSSPRPHAFCPKVSCTQDRRFWDYSTRWNFYLGRGSRLMSSWGRAQCFKANITTGGAVHLIDFLLSISNLGTTCSINEVAQVIYFTEWLSKHNRSPPLENSMISRFLSYSISLCPRG